MNAATTGPQLTYPPRALARGHERPHIPTHQSGSSTITLPEYGDWRLPSYDSQTRRPHCYPPSYDGTGSDESGSSGQGARGAQADEGPITTEEVARLAQ